MDANLLSGFLGAQGDSGYDVNDQRDAAEEEERAKCDKPALGCGHCILGRHDAELLDHHDSAVR